MTPRLESHIFIINSTQGWLKYNYNLEKTLKPNFGTYSIEFMVIKMHFIYFEKLIYEEN